MEWNALIPVGRSTLRVRFSGGSATGYGVSPATFATDNRAVQRVIEESSFFRNGKIYVLAREEDGHRSPPNQAVKKNQGGPAAVAPSDPIARMKHIRGIREAEKEPYIYNKEKEVGKEENKNEDKDRKCG